MSSFTVDMRDEVARAAAEALESYIRFRSEEPLLRDFADERIAYYREVIDERRGLYASIAAYLEAGVDVTGRQG
jgi:hypothetical protein